MLSTLNPPADPDLILFLGALALVVGGVVFIFSGMRTRRELIDERVAIATQKLAKEAAPVETKRAVTAPLVRNVDLSPVDRELARQFTRLGVPQERVKLVFLALRLVTALVFGALILAIGPNIALLAKSTLLETVAIIGCAAFGWYLPELIIRDLRQRRAAEVAAGLPDALDLLVICTEAGLALEDGIERVAAELRLSQPALADELALTAADLKVLPSSEQALTRLAERINLPAMHSLVTTLSQTMRYGTPLAQAMRVVAAELRNDSLLRLEERANGLPALMTIPMIIFIIPTIFLILGGPAALSIIDILSR